MAQSILYNTGKFYTKAMLFLKNERVMSNILKYQPLGCTNSEFNSV